MFEIPPICFTLELTNFCNQNCIACSNIELNYKPKFVKNWKYIIEKISSSKYSQLIRISGGEPTLHPEFFEIINFINDKNINFVLFSNANWDTLLLNTIIKNFKNFKNFRGFLISLHGNNEELHEKYTNKKNSFHNIVNSIKSLSSNGFDVFTNTVITKYNFDKIDQIIFFSESIGAKCAIFNRLLAEKTSNYFFEYQLKHSIKEIKRLHEDGYSCKLGNCIPQCFISNDSEGSIAGFEHCFINHKGDLKPDDLSLIKFGNIFKDEIETIWMSQIVSKYRKNLSVNCKSCVKLNHCRGGIKSFPNHDTLIKKTSKFKKSIINLNLNNKPISNYKLELINDKIYLLRYTLVKIFPITHFSLLNSLNGEFTINELITNFGEGTLDLIGNLYYQNFIELI